MAAINSSSNNSGTGGSNMYRVGGEFKFHILYTTLGIHLINIGRKKRFFELCVKSLILINLFCPE